VREAGIGPLPRLPDAAPRPIGQALSAGALDIIVPRVESAAQAADIMRITRFAPAGRRPQPPVFPHFRRTPLTQAGAVGALAAGTVTVVVIETRYPVANAAAIAAVEGVDVSSAPRTSRPI